MLFAIASHAQAPAGSTGECKDGSYTSSPGKRNACYGHGGIKEWYENPVKAAPGTPPAPAKGAPVAVPTDPSKTPGAVWVNTKSKIYYCQGDKWYGKTKQGNYMSESAAKAAGDKPSRGKTCS
jgi:hypothetical protein